MKRASKLLVILLALCQLVCVFSACNKDGSKHPAETDHGDDGVFAMTKENLAQYVIVVPHEKADSLKNIVGKLQLMIKQTPNNVSGSQTLSHAHFQQYVSEKGAAIEEPRFYLWVLEIREDGKMADVWNR